MSGAFLGTPPAVKQKRGRGRPCGRDWEALRGELSILVNMGFGLVTISRHLGNITPAGVRLALRRLGLKTQGQRKRDGTPT